MQAAMFIVAATAVTFSAERISATPAIVCEADHQCENGYCYQATKMCAPCTNCSVYLRTAPKWKKCVKSPQECGPCQAGYEEEILAEGDRRNFCIPVKPQKTSENIYIGIGSLGGMIVLVVALSLIWRVWKNTPNQRNNPEADDTPPPSYSTSLLTPTVVVSNERVDAFEVSANKENHSLEQAVPFKDALPPFNRNGIDIEAENDSDEGEEQPVAHFPVAPHLDLEDEDTIPSTWSPSCEIDPQYSGHFVNAQINGEPHATTNNHSSSNVTSSESSLSELSDASELGIENARNFIDSGVSATCSQQSSSKSLSVRHFSQFSSNPNPSSSAILQRCRSDEDVTQNSQERKRPRRDSGSASLPSVTPDDPHVDQDVL